MAPKPDSSGPRAVAMTAPGMTFFGTPSCVLAFSALRKLACVLLLSPGIVLADEVFLKDAGSISGRIVEQTADTIKIDVGDGIIGVPTARVERFTKGRTPLDEYDDR